MAEAADVASPFGSGTRLYPHPGVTAVLLREPMNAVASVVCPAIGFSPAAPAFADIAREVARRRLRVPYADLPR